MAIKNATKKPKKGKQVLFAHDEDTRFIALTPSESGLSLRTVIEALEEIEQVRNSDSLTVIFEDSESGSSWTIQQVAFDKTWVRLS